MKPQTFASPRSAFTLIELLVSVSVVVLLAALLIRGTAQIRESASGTHCLNNLRQLGVAMNLYANDHHGAFTRTWVPTVPGDPETGVVWNDRLTSYLSPMDYEPNKLATRFWNLKVWFCRSAAILNGNPGVVWADRHYGLNPWIRDPNWNFQRAKVPEPSRIVLIGEINQNGDSMWAYSPGIQIDTTGKQVTGYRMSHKGGRGANYLFCDGHTEYREGALSDLNAATSPWKWW